MCMKGGGEVYSIEESIKAYQGLGLLVLTSCVNPWPLRFYVAAGGLDLVRGRPPLSQSGQFDTMVEWPFGSKILKSLIFKEWHEHCERLRSI